MKFIEPVTLRGQIATLEPLALEHEAGLAKAAADGELWRLWYTGVAPPDKMAGYVATALDQRARLDAMPFVVRENATGDVVGCTREDCAGFAADAYARINGLGAVCVTYCVGGLNVLNAIAGAYAGSGPLPEAPADEWPRMMHANLDSAYSTCRAALPHLRKSHGAIVTGYEKSPDITKLFEHARQLATEIGFELKDLDPVPAGALRIDVRFLIDANGILHVSAKDKATSKEQKIRIEASSGLSDSDIDKMVKDAEKNAAEDKKRREEIDTRNRLDSLTYEVEKNSKEWSDKLPAELKGKLEAAVERSRKALKGDDMGEIRAAQEDLNKTFSEAGQSFYAQSQGAPSGDTGGTGAPGGETGGADATSGGAKPADDVVEADYEIVDESKK
jgi:hypothetical protein